MLATFPNRTVGADTFDEVPTSVQRGPDGALYVGQLTGFPFIPGAANVYRVGRHGHVSVAATGFTNIIDIAFDKWGRLYVLEIFKNGLLSGDPTGALIRVSRNGTPDRGHVRRTDHTGWPGHPGSQRVRQQLRHVRERRGGAAHPAQLTGSR